MATDITNSLMGRPILHAVTSFTEDYEHYDVEASEDKLAILVSQIKIWKPTGTDWFNIPGEGGCLCIRECESIEITDSSKTLVNNAVVRFARGTVINKSSLPDDKVDSGNPEDDLEAKETLKDTLQTADVYIKNSSLYIQGSKAGESITSAAVNYDSKGLIEFNRTEEDPALLSPNDLAVGNRIQIRLGYAYSEKEFKEMNIADSHPDMPVVFTGFITGISSSTPLEIECTNMAYILDCVSVPDMDLKDTKLIKDFLDEGSEFNLLSETGLTLADECKGQEISVSGGSLTNNLSIADVLQTWNEVGVRSFFRVDHNSGVAKLHVGLTYYAGTSNGLPTDDKKYIVYRGGSQATKIIQFDWDVAEDKLNVKESDKKYLAVQATGKLKDGNTFKFIKVTIRKNPDNDDKGWVLSDADWQTINVAEAKPKKARKTTGGNTNSKYVMSKIKNKVKLDRYTVLPYISLKIDITQDELVEEAKQYWETCAPNGISGHVTLFGDLMIDPTDIIGLYDQRQPEKCGYYFVESVHTTFGINGYRRELTIPYKVRPLKAKIIKS